MDNSQLDAKISGMDVKLGQKRDSMLAQTNEVKNEGKDRSSNVQVTPAKVKCSQIGVIESNLSHSAGEHVVRCCKFSGKLTVFCEAEIFFYQTDAV